MSFVIEQKIMPGLPNYSLKSSRYIIAHDSGNAANNGPDSLERELSFMARNKANAFVSHWVGCGGRIVQVAPVGKLQYGCGPIGNPYCYAQVELARTNNKETFKKDYAAYVWLLRKLAKDAGLPIKLDEKGYGIKTHRWISYNLGGTDHVDPYGYLNSFGISEEQFKKDIENGIEEEEEMDFFSPTMRDKYNMRTASPATKQLLVEKAVAGLGYQKSWIDNHNKGLLKDGDYAAIAFELAVHYAKSVK